MLSCMSPPGARPVPADPVLESLRGASPDDEPYTDEERAEDEAARRDPERVSSAEIRRRLGL
jgi:hypothetical protein